MDQWQIGSVRITRIEEMIVTGSNEFVLPDAHNPDCLPYNWMQPHFMDAEGFLIFSIHGLVVDTGAHKILVDTCVGNDKERNVPDWDHLQTSFMQDLESAGYPPGEIDTVMCTHLHVDHVGWNTSLVDGAWVPTFPNARYLVAESEWAHWHDNPDVDGEGPIMSDSIQPIVDAGLMDFVGSEHQICPEVRLEPTPGHTPGHVSVHITSQGQEALITGDCVHHPVQLARPEWSSSADSDQSKAIATRAALFDKYADGDVLIIGTHFPSPTAGRIRSADVGAYWLDTD